jgi:subfamily B ATP-binding cassette protein MsbA
VGEGLRKTWGRVVDALGGAGAWNDRLAAAKDAGVAGLSDIQNNASPLELLTWLCFIALGAVFFKNLSDYGRKVAFIRVEQAAVEALRNDIFRRILHFPLSTMNRISSGQFISRTVTDIEFVKSLTISNVANFVHNLFLVTVYLSISVWASYQLALASLLIVPVVGLLTGKLASKLRRHSARAQARIAELTGSLSETLGGIRIVKAFGTENREQSRFAATTSQYRSAVVRLLSLDRLAAPLSEFWGVAIGLGVLYYGGQLLLAPEPSITTGRFFVFLFALVSMLHPLKQLTNVVTGFQRGAVAANRVFEILEMDIETDDPNPLPLPTAVVGPSGAGKSTLVELIPRFYKPDSGRILIDGTDLERVRRSELRALIGIVSQESILFNDTVMNNIAYGSDSPTREAVIEAAQAANAHEFIETMPRGYDTVIGERGVRLSGGQRQRLAIARAVLRNPAILILDEATSSLDTESENLVQEALERLLAGRTTFVIAHRLSTVVQADRILVLDQGRIVQTGTHTELATRPGLYNRLYTLQFRTDEAPRLDAVES